MKRLTILASLVALLAVLVAPGSAGVMPSQASQNIVRNGSFERPVAPVGGILTFFGGQTFDGWRVRHHSIDLIGEGYWEHAAGKQSVDLSGNARGGIGQTLQAVAGQNYTLRFALAGNPDGLPAMKTMRVIWEGIVVADLDFDTTGHSREDMGWTYYEFSVVANSSSPHLRFLSMTAGPNGPAVDDVTVTPVGT